MKLSLLHETVSCGDIAVPPAGSYTTRRRKKKDVQEEATGTGGIGTAPKTGPDCGVTGHSIKNRKDTVWQPLKGGGKGSGDWYSKDGVYALKNNPDERLLQNFRGHGY